MLRLCSTAAFFSTATATSFYFSNSGSDTAAGTSPMSAWQSLRKTLTADFQPGDHVLLERGSVWTDETLDLKLAEGLTVGAYGNETFPTPRIVGTRHSTPQFVDCVTATNPSNFQVSDLHITQCSRGIHFTFSGSRGVPITSTNLTITRCFFSDIRSPVMAYNPSLPDWAKAITLESVRGSGSVDGLTISHNVALRIDQFYGAKISIDRLLLESNTIAQCNGNCVFLGSGTDMLLNNSVFVRDNPVDLFLYGTTDVIVGTISGQNSVRNTDFNQRGEFQGGPDGCALDFETSADGFNVTGCNFYHSFGGGIMIFGHQTTSHNLNLSDNTFVDAGCTQVRGDRAGIAVQCPNKHEPSGIITSNHFWTCNNSEAIHEAYPGCMANMKQDANTFNKGGYVAQPQINIEPPSPDSTDKQPFMPVVGSTSTEGATLRYTLDGSRPSETSPILPPGGFPQYPPSHGSIKLAWPGPNVAVNVRAFREGMTPSVTNSMIIERATYQARNVGLAGLRSNLDGVTVNATHGTVTGWIVDPYASFNWKSVSYQVLVDYLPVVTGVANIPRPDLIPAQAPNAPHGFSALLPVDAVAKLQRGVHTVGVVAHGSPSSGDSTPLGGSPIIVRNGDVA